MATESKSTPPIYSTEHTFKAKGEPLTYKALAGWQTLYEREKPVAEIFHVAYLKQDSDSGSSSPHRPLTFVFNGGPGAASAYLHMGALGPRRIQFGPNGSLPASPVRLVDNAESWLPFSDLVFIDPVGTGFSRALPKDKENTDPSKAGDPPKEASPESGGKAEDPPKEAPFWNVERDLKSLGEFIQGFLSRHKRWLSPIFIAGESYGGFRVARLAKELQSTFGVGLSGAILISPAIEFSLLETSDYNLTTWATLFPSYVASAAHHGLSSWGEDLSSLLPRAETFARQRLLPLLAMGEAMPEAERQAVYQDMAAGIGLSAEYIAQKGGRIDISSFARELLRPQRQVVGLYDASVTAVDPFPDRPTFEGSDPTLDGLDRLFTAAINSHLRDTLQVNTELTYHLLNFEVFKAWQFNQKGEFKQGFIGAMDELRTSMALNPHMRVNIHHGLYDLVTPYFASNHLVDLMKLDPRLKDNLTLKHYRGGHMFYTWDPSRLEWFAAMQQLYREAVPPELRY
ncbi:peptidase S10 [Synechococcus sp. Nb3U1]|uniref:S10 family peptidase n=1 Tax=Synechococcus sp. Nb3U1 TaxID=1914529 RepID=UPI001F4334C6|nr:peptidase S10 [Synechococcus sp. Nb3U1]MCF2972363.1 peptidase S10 [Synechococcus sp. Nb3U1]